MYRVNHTGYCGMSGVPSCFDDRAEARRYAAERLRRYRRRFPVVTLEKGAQWEILEPEGCSMVPDACGVLYLDRVTWECRECGSAHDSQHDALHCCAEYGRDEG